MLQAGHRTKDLGGNVSTNAGGMRAVKYGVTRHQVLGVEAVLAPGELVRVGGPLRKDVAGGANPRDVKFELAREIVGRFHGAAAADAINHKFGCVGFCGNPTPNALTLVDAERLYRSIATDGTRSRSNARSRFSRPLE